MKELNIKEMDLEELETVAGAGSDIGSDMVPDPWEAIKRFFGF